MLEGSRFKQLADETRIRLVPRSPIRGRLLDRKGRVLATSKLTYSLYLEPRLVSDANWPGLRDRLASVLNLDPLLLDQRCDRGTDRDGYRRTLLLDLKPEQVLRFREQAATLSGAQVDVDRQHRWSRPCLVWLLCPISRRQNCCCGIRPEHTRRWFCSCVADGEESSCRLGTIASKRLSQGLGQVF